MNCIIILSIIGYIVFVSYSLRKQYKRNNNIIRKLLYYYQYCLNNLPEDYNKAIEFCNTLNINYGLCFCASAVFNKIITREKWIVENSNVSVNDSTLKYWYNTPNRCNTTEEIKKCLEYRIAKLQSLL